MEDRRYRPKFWNPFTKKGENPYQPFKGWFRVVPLHRFRFATIAPVLQLVSLRPHLFGLPKQTTCIVNTWNLLHSARSRDEGITVFGPERGCKTVVIPPSCSGQAFDEVDAKLMEPLFRWNPSIETLYLSKDCEMIAGNLAQLLAQRQRLMKTIILVDWESAVNINKVVMSCKSVEEVDIMAPDETFKSWNNEVSIEAMCELIEMHPKLKMISGNNDSLGAIYTATRWSRCRHNIALIPTWCGFGQMYYQTWLVGVLMFSVLVAGIVYRLIRDYIAPQSVGARDLTWLFVLVATFTTIVGVDYFRHQRVGRAWTYYVKYLVMLRYRMDKFLNR
jgi:hypothetical protein